MYEPDIGIRHLDEGDLKATSMNSKRDQALAAFDAYNSTDPHLFEWAGTQYPRELFFAQRLYEWVLRLCPDASEPLILASRSQHIGRWEVPRNSYPEGRAGYLAWRRDLMNHHADKAGEILRSLGYEETVIDRVRAIISKNGIKRDPDVQVMENGLCLVFLQYQYEDFHKANADKIVDILKKSLLKMDTAGRRAALSLSYSEQGLVFIKEALAQIPA
jgi:hypothetical protein